MMQKLQHDAQGYRHQLFENMGSSSGADSITHLIGSTQQQIEKVTYDHFSQVRALCTDEQKKEFDAIIGDVTKRMNGRGGPPHHDRAGPPPGDRPDGPPPP